MVVDLLNLSSVKCVSSPDATNLEKYLYPFISNFERIFLVFGTLLRTKSLKKFKKNNQYDYIGGILFRIEGPGSSCWILGIVLSKYLLKTGE